MGTRRRFHYAWVICAYCFILMIFTVPLVNTLGSLYLNVVTADFNISRSSFTFTSTIVGICGMLLSPLWGKIYSMWRMKPVLTVAAALFSLSYMSYSLAQNAFHLYISAACVGLTFSGCALMPMSMLITSWFKKRRGLAMSIALGGIGIGGTCLSNLITWVIATYGWRHGYQIVGAGVFCIIVPLTLLLLRQTPKSMGMEPYGAEEPGVESGSSVTDRELDIPLDQARKHAFFWVHLFGMFLLGFVCSAPLRQIFPYVTDLHDATLAATIVALYSFVGIFGKLLLGWITDRIGPIYGAMFAFSLMALSFALLIGGEDRMLLYVMACVYGVGNAVGSVSAPLLISGTFGTRDFNLMRGIAQSPIQLGMSLGGLALAGVFDLIGSYVPGWGACIVLSLLAGGCFIWSYASSRKIFATQMAV